MDRIPKAEIKILIQASYVAGDLPPSLCVGEGNCYSLEGDSCSFDPSFPGWKGGEGPEDRCVVATYEGGSDPLADDHPFVQDPDQWDLLYLDLPKDSALTGLRRFVLTLEYHGGPNYRFVDESFASPLDFSGGARISMEHWVAERRRCVVKSAFCGYSDMDCHGQDSCLRRPDFQKVYQVPWGFFPTMVREAANDLGQTGAWKYVRGRVVYGAELPGDNGCDEFYFFYASQFANNLHHPAANTSFFPSERAGIGPGKWLRAERLAEVVFDETAGGGRAVADPPVRRVVGDWEPRGQAYEPKAGDYFLVWETENTATQHPKQKAARQLWEELLEPIYVEPSSGSSGLAHAKLFGKSTALGRHAMIALDAPYLDSSDGHLKVPVIDKWTLAVEATTRDLNDWGGSHLDMAADPNWHFFFGEVDHELGGSQQLSADGLELTNPGFCSWFSTVVSD